MAIRAIWQNHEIRCGVKRGAVECRDAYRYADVFFRLGDLRLGKGHHKDTNAFQVATFEEADALIGQGYSIRLRSGARKASLNVADGVVIEEWPNA